MAVARARLGGPSTRSKALPLRVPRDADLAGMIGEGWVLWYVETALGLGDEDLGG